MKSNRRNFLASGLASGLGAGLVLRTTPAWAAAAKSDGSGPVVETTAGKIRGAVDGKVSAFRGVPYGASTAGTARFMPPEKPQPWAGVKDTVELGHRSPQGPSGLIPEVAAVDANEAMGEDCLVLNVWTPSATSRQKRPVMVWLHGGGFTSGSGGFKIYDGANLAGKHDVVVVTVNHRLNAFGYLYLSDLGGAQFANASNVGMLDIVAALEWVRDNISNFGGDPANVTIFGQSGGGAKVCTLLGMPSAKGLFHRAIVESGASLNGMPRDAANKATEAFFAKVGLKPDQAGELQKVPVDRILQALAGGRFGPVVDGKTLPANPFDPASLAISSSVPLLIGTTQTEVTFFAGQQLDPIDEAALRARVKQTFHSSDADTDKVIAAYKQVDPAISNIDIALESASDSFALTNAIAAAERKLALAKAPAYMYYFKWRSPVRDGKLKAMHCMEIPFVFENMELGQPMTGSGQDRYALAAKISGAWAAFARTGNPNQKGLDWPAYSTSQRATMVFDDKTEVVDDPRKVVRQTLASLKS